MNSEDDEFNRIEREAKVRMMAVKYALERQRAKDMFADMPEAIPFVTREELEKLLDEWARKYQ